MTKTRRFRLLHVLALTLCLIAMPLHGQDRDKSVVHVPADAAASIIEKALSAKQPQLAAA